MAHETMIDGDELLRLLGGVATASTFEGVNMVRHSSVLELVRRRVDEARSRPAAEPADAGRGQDEVSAMDAIVAAFNTWPDDLRKKLSLHDLRRMTGWRPIAPESAAVGLLDGTPLVEEWFVCCHPAWPDPRPAGHSASEAVAALAWCPHPDAWLLRKLTGGRVEFRGENLTALVNSQPARSQE